MCWKIVNCRCWTNILAGTLIKKLFFHLFKDRAIMVIIKVKLSPQVWRNSLYTDFTSSSSQWSFRGGTILFDPVFQKLFFWFFFNWSWHLIYLPVYWIFFLSKNLHFNTFLSLSKLKIGWKNGKLWKPHDETKRCFKHQV